MDAHQISSIINYTFYLLISFLLNFWSPMHISVHIFHIVLYPKKFINHQKNNNNKQQNVANVNRMQIIDIRTSTTATCYLRVRLQAKIIDF